MKLVVLCVLLCIYAHSCHATVLHNLRTMLNNMTDDAQRVHNKLKSLTDQITGSGGDQSAWDDQGNHLKKRFQLTNQRGDKTTRMTQYYTGIKIFGYEIVENEVLHGEVQLLDKETGNPTGMHTITAEKQRWGHFLDGLQSELGAIDQSSFDGNAAIDHGRTHCKKHRGYAEDHHMNTSKENSELVIYYNPSEKRASVVHHVKFEIDDPQWPSKPNMLVDRDGNVLKIWDDIQNSTHNQDIEVVRGTGPGGNSGNVSGIYRYGSDKPNLKVEIRNGTCYYNTQNVRTVNLNNQYSRRITDAFEFPCFEQSGDSVNGAASPINDAHAFGDGVQAMYKDWYSALPPALPKLLLINVHYGDSYENAFWDGEAMFFGDGQDEFYPLVALDIMSHEIGHGVTDGASKLIYEGQSGGVNEAFSDMAGKAAERHQWGKDGVNWGVGLSVMKSGKPLRCMDNPTCDGKSIDNVADYREGLDVHYSSGPFNKAFYNMAQKFANDVWDAFDAFYVANLKHWTPSSDYKDAAEGVMHAIDDLRNGRYLGYKYTHLNVQDAIDAFQDVGLFCVKSTTWTCDTSSLSSNQTLIESLPTDYT